MLPRSRRVEFIIPFDSLTISDASATSEMFINPIVCHTAICFPSALNFPTPLCECRSLMPYKNHGGHLIALTTCQTTSGALYGGAVCGAGRGLVICTDPKEASLEHDVVEEKDRGLV